MCFSIRWPVSVAKPQFVKFLNPRSTFDQTSVYNAVFILTSPIICLIIGIVFRSSAINVWRICKMSAKIQWPVSGCIGQYI